MSADSELLALRKELKALADKFKSASTKPGSNLRYVAEEAHAALYDAMLEIDGWMGWDE